MARPGSFGPTSLWAPEGIFAFERRFLAVLALACVLCAPVSAETPKDVVFRDLSLARVRVSCVGNLFFDISNADFTLTDANGLPFADGFESGSTSAWSP